MALEQKQKIGQTLDRNKNSFLAPYSLGSIYQRWLKRRIPPQSPQRLHNKNIFIFPSRVGAGFLLVLVLLWILGTNYQNNIMIALSFLLLSLFHTCIFYTYRNFSGLEIALKHVKPCFAGEVAMVELVVNARTGQKNMNVSTNARAKASRQATRKASTANNFYSIQLQFPGSPMVTVHILNGESQTVKIPVPTQSRGSYRAPRLSVSTVYPLGIIRAWSHLDLAIDLMVYPKPIPTPLPSTKNHVADDDSEWISDKSTVISRGTSDDISHLRPYQKGDPLSHIAWKTLAKGQGLATKTYEESIRVDQQQWLEWNDFSGTVEQRLSQLCDCVLQVEENEYTYGLVMPNGKLDLGQGTAHQQRALRELALFQQPVNNVEHSYSNPEAFASALSQKASGRTHV